MMPRTRLVGLLASHIKKRPFLATLLSQVVEQLYPDKVIFLDYPVAPKQRWGSSTPHSQLWEILNAGRAEYADLLRCVLNFRACFSRVVERPSRASSPSDPVWINGWMPALDGMSLYTLIATKRPNKFLEVGSGNSTKFARWAIRDQGLDTEIISIDPHPRVEIDALCTRVIRAPVETVDLEMFDVLEPGDMLYVDNSHRVFTNSDATVIFLDVLPRLKPGVLVHIHDVMLPYDYPAEWADRFYSEQYLLAGYLLAKGKRIKPIAPLAFISGDPELRNMLVPLWTDLPNVERHGVSFWFEIADTP
jgi:Methyltransferase domain